jgi:hypothetical protein
MPFELSNVLATLISRVVAALSDPLFVSDPAAIAVAPLLPMSPFDPSAAGALINCPLTFTVKPSAPSAAIRPRVLSSDAADTLSAPPVSTLPPTFETAPVEASVAAFAAESAPP